MFDFKYHPNIDVIRKEPSRVIEGHGGEVLVNCFLLSGKRLLLAFVNNTLVLDENLDVLSEDKCHKTILGKELRSESHCC